MRQGAKRPPKKKGRPLPPLPGPSLPAPRYWQQPGRKDNWWNREMRGQGEVIGETKRYCRWPQEPDVRWIDQADEPIDYSTAQPSADVREQQLAGETGSRYTT